MPTYHYRLRASARADLSFYAKDDEDAESRLPDEINAVNPADYDFDTTLDNIDADLIDVTDDKEHDL